MGDKLFTIEECATRLSLSLPTTYRFVKEKKIAHFRLGVRRIAFSEEQIEHFLILLEYRVKFIN